MNRKQDNVGFGCVLFSGAVIILFQLALYAAIIYLIYKIAVGDVF